MTNNIVSSIMQTVLVVEGIGDQLKRITKPLGKGAEQALRSQIEAKARQVEILNKQKIASQWEEAKKELTNAFALWEEHSARLAEALKEFAEVEPARVFRALIYALLTVTCMSAEFSLTYETLPFILNVPKMSFRGIMLGAAPVAALAILEWAIALALIEPYRAARKFATQSRLRRIVAFALMSVFVTGLIYGNVKTVWLLADAREEVAKAKRNLDRTDEDVEIPVDQKVIKDAILAVSIAVVIDGSLFLLLLMLDLPDINKRLKSGVRIWRLRRKQGALRAAYLHAEAEEKIRQSRAEQSEELARVLAQEFRDRCLFELEQALDQESPPKPMSEMVDEILMRGVIARKNGRDKELAVTS